MNADEKVLIENLAQRLQQAQLSDIDTDAEKLIQKLMSNQPRAMYLLTQAVLLQEHALKASQDKIKQLEQEARQAATPKKGGFLSGLFGGSSQQNNHSSAGNSGFTQSNNANYSSSPNYSQQQHGYAQPQANDYRPSRGSSFMGQAASTALGVAGGALLFEGVSHMFGGRGGFGEGFLGGNHETIVNETIINEAPDSDQFANQDFTQGMDTGGWNDPSSDFASGNDSFTSGDNWNSDFSGDQASDSGSGFGFDNSGFDNSGFDNGGGFDDGGFSDFGGSDFGGGGFDDSSW